MCGRKNPCAHPLRSGSQRGSASLQAVSDHTRLLRASRARPFAESGGARPGYGLPASMTLLASVEKVSPGFSLDGLVGHAPRTEARYHDAVRAKERRGMGVAGQVKPVAFWQIRWFLRFSHASLYVARRCLDHPRSNRAREVRHAVQCSSGALAATFSLGHAFPYHCHRSREEELRLWNESVGKISGSPHPCDR
jgi:hypothetical protein